MPRQRPQRLRPRWRHWKTPNASSKKRATSLMNLERWEAIKQVCAQFNSEDLVEYLLPFLGDPEPLVRVDAIDALEGIPQPQIDDHLLGVGNRR